MTFSYESWLKQAQDRLEELYQQREAIDEEISVLQKGIVGFAPLLKKHPIWGGTIGLTDAIRQVFRSQPHRLLTPIELKYELLNRGVKLGQRNPMANIHQILGRLLNRDREIGTHIMDGRTLYHWIGPTSAEDTQAASPASEQFPIGPKRKYPEPKVYRALAGGKESQEDNK